MELESSFFLDAWIIGGRPQHDRVAYHTGQELAENVVLDEAIGGYPARMPVQDVIADLYARIMALEGGNHTVATFDLDAEILAPGTVIGTPPGTIRGAIALVAAIKRSQAGTFELDAFLARGGTVALDAVIAAVVPSFTLDAWVI